MREHTVVADIQVDPSGVFQLRGSPRDTSILYAHPVNASWLRETLVADSDEGRQLRARLLLIEWGRERPMGIS